MVVRFGIAATLVVLLLSGFSAASETGSYAFRAQKLYQSGKYEDALRILHTGLQMSAKEADLEGESRIYMAMAQILFHAYEFEMASKMIGQVRVSELNANAKLSLLRLRMQMANYQGNFSDASTQWEQNRKFLDKDDLSEPGKAMVLLEYCVTRAGLGQSCDKDRWEEAEDLLDDEAPGAIAYAKGRAADAEKNEEKVRKYYKTAMEYAHKKQRSWEAGQMLIRLAQLDLAKGDQEKASDGFLRAAKLYHQLRLDRPFLQAAEAYLALGKDDREIGMAVGDAKSRIAPVVAP